MSKSIIKLVTLSILFGIGIFPKVALATPLLLNPPAQKEIDQAAENFTKLTKGILDTQGYYLKVDWGTLSNLEVATSKQRVEAVVAFATMRAHTKTLLPLLKEVEILQTISPDNDILTVYKNIISNNLLLCEAAEKYLTSFEISKKVDYKEFNLAIEHDRNYGKWYKIFYDEINQMLASHREEVPKKRKWHTALTVAASSPEPEKVPTGPEIASLFAAGTRPIADMDTALEIFRKGPKEIQNAQIEEIKAHSSNFPPIIFYSMASILNHNGKKDEALFWFLAAELRGKFNANLYNEGKLHEYLERRSNLSAYPVKEYAQENPEKLEQTIADVLDWDKKTKHCYNPQWISKGYLVTPEIKPQAQWIEIWEQTRKDFKENYKNTLGQPKEFEISKENFEKVESGILKDGKLYMEIDWETFNNIEKSDPDTRLKLKTDLLELGINSSKLIPVFEELERGQPYNKELLKLYKEIANEGLSMSRWAVQYLDAYETPNKQNSEQFELSISHKNRYIQARERLKELIRKAREAQGKDTRNSETNQ